jgi:hypothetical protein
MSELAVYGFGDGQEIGEIRWSSGLEDPNSSCVRVDVDVIQVGLELGVGALVLFHGQWYSVVQVTHQKTTFRDLNSLTVYYGHLQFTALRLTKTPKLNRPAVWIRERPQLPESTTFTPSPVRVFTEE